MSSVRNQSGFSLIELIITISILIVLSGMTFLGINFSRGKELNQHTRELCRQIELIQTISMSRSGIWRLGLYEKDGDYYCVQERKNSSDGGGWDRMSEPVDLGYKGAIHFPESTPEEEESSLEHGRLIWEWRFDRDTGACTKGAGLMEISGVGRTQHLTVYLENGTCEITE